jgi:ribosome-associated protein
MLFYVTSFTDIFFGEAVNVMEEFKLKGQEFIELNDLLKSMGLIESGGMAKVVIAEGQVKVDGAIELRRRCKIRTGQRVEFSGHTVIVL